MSDNYNGMYLSTLEDREIQDGYEKLRNANKKAIPHFSILKDHEVKKATLSGGKVWFFSDKNGNIYIYGFYAGGYNKDKPSPLKLALDGGVIKQTNFLAFRDRETSGDFIGKSASKLESWEIGGTDFGKSLNIPLSTSWYKAMEHIESSGKIYKDPILLIVKDTSVVSLSQIWAEYGKYIIAVLSVAISFVPMGGVLSKLSNVLVSKLDSVINGTANISDFMELAEGFAPNIADSLGLQDVRKGVIDSIPTEIKNIARTGGAVYGAVKSDDPDAILSIFGLGTVSGLSDWREIEQAYDQAKKIADSVASGDIDSLAKETGVDKYVAEKVRLQFDASKLLDSLKNLDPQIKVSNAFELPEIQSYVKNTYSSLLQRAGENLQGMNAVIPNTTVAMKYITDSVILKPNELKGLINTFQGEYTNAQDFKGILTATLIEEAKSFQNTNIDYYIPSNLPPERQVEIGNMIMKELNVNVKSVNPKVEMALNNFKEFE